MVAASAYAHKKPTPIDALLLERHVSLPVFWCNLLGTIDDGFDKTLPICALPGFRRLEGRHGVVELVPNLREKLHFNVTVR